MHNLQKQGFEGAGMVVLKEAKQRHLDVVKIESSSGHPTVMEWNRRVVLFGVQTFFFAVILLYLFIINKN